MDCAVVATHLVAYHFATTSDEERDAVDAHLLGCRPCLEAYFALKRATTTRPLERPSARVKSRLRAEVAAAFPSKTARPKLLVRRIPLYQGLFAAAAAAAIALAVPGLLEGRRAPAQQSNTRIDSARPSAESFRIY